MGEHNCVLWCTIYGVSRRSKSTANETMRDYAGEEQPTYSARTEKTFARNNTKADKA